MDPVKKKKIDSYIHIPNIYIYSYNYNCNCKYAAAGGEHGGPRGLASEDRRGPCKEKRREIHIYIYIYIYIYICSSNYNYNYAAAGGVHGAQRGPTSGGRRGPCEGESKAHTEEFIDGLYTKGTRAHTHGELIRE